MSSSSLSSESPEIEIRGPRSVMGSLRKLWDGFCFPSEETKLNDDMGNDRARRRSTTKQGRLHSMPGTIPPDTVIKSEATATEEEPTTQVQRKRTEIVVTNQGRRKRVVRGLEVALVALASVVVTLLTLHRLGYVADLQFTKSSRKISNRLGLQSRPLIKIKKNIKDDRSAMKRPRWQ